MNELSRILQQRSTVSRQLVSTGIHKVNTTDTTVFEKKSSYSADGLFEQLTDLVNNDFRAWYCKAFYQLGETRVLELASLARQDGKDRRKYFSYLIRKNV